MQEHVTSRLDRVLRKYAGRSDALAKQAIKSAKEKYRLDEMLEKGIQASQQIAVATHLAKGIHPDLEVKKATNLRVQPDALTSHLEVGSHLLAQQASIADTTGNSAYNAATYELYLLLDLRFEGKTLCQWLEMHDSDTLRAFANRNLHQDEIAQWAARFTDLMKEKNARPATDSRAKQVYWLTGADPVDDAAYHLLAPLYPTALVHAVHGTIYEDRFGDANKDIRQARYQGEPHEGIFYDYPDLAVQKLGGSQPQNISHLNNERGGTNYLLASLPPSWRPIMLRPLNHSDDLWNQFFYFRDVPDLVKELAEFLLSDPKPVMRTRVIREGIEQVLGAQLVAFAKWVRNTLKPGWTCDSKCELDWFEKLWLDPQRAVGDDAFDKAYVWGDWPDEVAGKFSSRLNEKLRKAGLTTVGDAEYLHWARQAIIDVAWPIPLQRRASARDPEQVGDQA